MISGGGEQPKRERRSRTAVAAEADALKAPWRAFMRERGLNDSKTRDVVVDTFFATTEHVDLQTLLERARLRNPSIGFATVYRTLKLLEEAGLAHSRHFGAKNALYEVAAGRPHHDHLVCEGCGAIVEFVSEDIERAQELVARRHGFELRRHHHELYGLCAECQRAARRPVKRARR
jgi:Fur family ferric uptake transcriptional regulator